MLRSLYLAAAAVVATMIIAPLVTIVGLFRSNARSIDKLIHVWARMIVAASGVDLRVEGYEHVDQNRSYILLGNHSSYLDIPSLFAVLRHSTRFFAKASLFKIPIFGWGLKAAGFVPIDRKNRKTAVRSFDFATERIRKGNSIVIFPEEGRSRTGQMRPFQRGGFLLAIRSQLPIVPFALHGTYDALPPGRFRIKPGPVTVRFGQPIETEGMSVRAKDELMERVRGEIARMLEGETAPATSAFHTSS